MAFRLSPAQGMPDTRAREREILRGAYARRPARRPRRAAAPVSLVTAPRVAATGARTPPRPRDRQRARRPPDARRDRRRRRVRALRRRRRPRPSPRAGRRRRAGGRGSGRAKPPRPRTRRRRAASPGSAIGARIESAASAGSALQPAGARRGDPEVRAGPERERRGEQPGPARDPEDRPPQGARRCRPEGGGGAAETDRGERRRGAGGEGCSRGADQERRQAERRQNEGRAGRSARAGEHDQRSADPDQPERRRGRGRRGASSRASPSGSVPLSRWTASRRSSSDSRQSASSDGVGRASGSGSRQASIESVRPSADRDARAAAVATPPPIRRAVVARAGPGDGLLAGPALVQDQRQRVDVRARAGEIALGLLGRHVGERADHVAGRRSASVRRRGGRCRSPSASPASGPCRRLGRSRSGA